MGDLKGGSQTTTSEVPEFVTDAGKFGVDRAKQISQMGYMPYFGPDVAALSPMESAGMQNTNQAASAFGMAAPGMGGGGGQGGVDPMTGLPAPTSYGGFNAYSSGPMYQGAVDELQRRRPGQFEAYESMFVDPQSGQMAGATQDQGQDQSQGLLDQVTGAGRFGDAQRRAIEQYGDASMAHMFMR